MFEVITVDGLTDAEQDTFTTLWRQLHDKRPRNLLRSNYYDSKQAVRHLGIAIPAKFHRLATVLGWSAKAVDVLNRRCNLEGFVLPGGDDSLIRQIWTENHLDTEAPQAGVSSLIHSCSFLATTQGDTQAGEPPVLITARDALSGTGQWDRRRRALSSALSVIDFDEDGRPVDFVLYLPNVNVFATKVGAGWRVARRQHRYGVPVEPLIYQPRLGRSFGSSRISRSVMSLHDSAIRTVIRSEVVAELYSVPARVLLGADESSFKNADGSTKTAWQAILGRVWGIPRDENGELPDVKEFKQGDQQPHIAQLRAWAQLFAGETSIPVSSLGLSTDANPASAEAYSASREDLISEAEGTIDGWAPAWRRTAINAMRMSAGVEVLPEQLLQVRPKFRSPVTQSRAAAADAASKTIDKFPWLAETRAGLELYGFDSDFIDQALAEKRRVDGRRALASLTAAAEPEPTTDDDA